MSFTQLNPPLPVQVIDKGEGYAVAVIDYGQEHSLIWVTAITDSGELWCAPNSQGAHADQLDDGSGTSRCTRSDASANPA